MAIDHSLTYQQFRFKNIPHLLRAKDIKNCIRNIALPAGEISYADFGCSNGFITAMIASVLGAKNVHGFDHTEENLIKAKENYADFIFNTIDLNNYDEYKKNPLLFDFVTCFETLEHVGNIDSAINIVYDSIKPNGKALISVPIEIGFKGIIKYLAKTIIYKYNLDELKPTPSFKEYFSALLNKKDIGMFRPKEVKGWATHFGFDYRHVDEWLDKNNLNYSSKNKGFTRFYIINK